MSSGGGNDPLAWGRVVEEVRDGRGRVDKGKLNVHVPSDVSAWLAVLKIIS